MLASIFEKGVIKFSCNFDLAQAGVQKLSNAELFTICLVVSLLLFAIHYHIIWQDFDGLIVFQATFPQRAFTALNVQQHILFRLTNVALVLELISRWT